jgi:hypothetical protein
MLGRVLNTQTMKRWKIIIALVVFAACVVLYLAQAESVGGRVRVFPSGSTVGQGNVTLLRFTITNETGSMMECVASPLVASAIAGTTNTFISQHILLKPRSATMLAFEPPASNWTFSVSYSRFPSSPELLLRSIGSRLGWTTRPIVQQVVSVDVDSK